MLKKTFLTVLLILILSSVSLMAADHSGKLLNLYGDSAASLGRGGTGVTSGGVDLFYLNPASIAGLERFGLGLQYGTVDGAYYNPDLSIAVPTSYGVVGGSFRMYFMPDTRDIKSAYSLSFGGAKELTPRLALGMALNLFYGTASMGNLFYIGATLGTIYTFRSTGSLHGFGIFNARIGASINFGAPFGSKIDYSQLNTLTLGYSFTFFKIQYFSLTFLNDLSFINLYRNYPVKFGLEAEIYDSIILRAGAVAPQSYDYGDFTCGAGYRLDTENFAGTINYAFNLYRDKTYIHYLGLTMEIGRLDTKAPETDIIPDTKYISPNHDGKKDFVLFSLHVDDESRIKGWRLAITDDTGRIVKDYKISERDMIKGLTFAGFFKRIFQKKVSMVVPETVLWDGTDNSGQIVVDGKYTYSFYAWDERDNIAAQKTGVIIVDNTPPEVSLICQDSLFSPNGDNRKDTLVINQNIKTSADDTWTAGFKDSSGAVVKSYTWTGNDVPRTIIWDGKDDAGNDAPEGLYYYFIGTTDRADNSASALINEISLTRQYETADINISSDYFSFKKDTALRMFLRLSARKGLSSWKVTVKDSGQKTVREFSGEGEVPPYIEWDCRDGNGKDLGDGEYFIQFGTLFASGNAPSSFVKKLVLDSTPPELKIGHRPDYFSPDSDGENDMLIINSRAVDNIGIRSWTIRIYSPAGYIFKTFNGRGDVPAELQWDGLGDNMDIVESAADYFLELEASDYAGNSSRSEKDKVKVDILVIVTERGLKMRISNIEFSFGRSEIAEKGKKILDRVAEILKKYANYDVVVEGHTDDIGEEAYNLSLSEKRAKSVQDYLIEKGIESARLQFIGMGETVPLYPNKSEENKRRNRRVEFLLIKKGE